MAAIRRRRGLPCLILLAFSLYIVPLTHSFAPRDRIKGHQSVSRTRIPSPRGIDPSPCSFQTSSFLSPLCANKNDNDDLLDASWNPKQQEQSQMPDYIASFLDKTKSNEDKNAVPLQERYTHCIAIPMDGCHELLLELESVQRAILYHCPALVHACIVPAMTRLPLLYVEASGKTSMTATKTLHSIVERVVRKHFYKEDATNDVDNDKEDIDLDGINAQGYRPLVLSFHNLEIDGQRNEVLHTVAMDDTGKSELVSMVRELKSEIELLGWKTAFPPDDQVDKKQEATTADTAFRPRVPFMRLPDNFESMLDPLPEGQEDWTRTADQGGNGISPILWHQWWEDTFAKHVRLREVGVYPRQTGRGGLSEQAFYLPHETTPLPNGNDALTKEEDKHRAYHDKRMAEAEGRPVDDAKETDDAIRDPAIEKERQHLESLYAREDGVDVDIVEDQSAEANDADKFDDGIKEEIEESLKAIDQVPMNDDQEECLQTPSKEEPSQQQLDEWTQERIRKTVEARASVQARKVQQKDMPPVEDNAVFQKYRDGTLVEKKKSTESSTPKQELPPYPSREHFFGIWRVVSSPTGFPEQVGDDTKSDNLIMRVDGTTSGGPVLDNEFQQKASGGTWKMLDATDDDGTRLRIRLVIPPKKERILVMEGEVTRLTTPSDMPMASSTFGIPQVEDAKARIGKGDDDLIHCGGQVWIEDAVTGKNREEIGTFSLQKISALMDPSQYTITIPRPVRSQD